MLIWIIAGIISGFIKGLCGVGDAPVFSAILAFASDNISISPVSQMMSLPANAYISWKERRFLDRRIWLPLSLLLICGSIPGTLLLKNTDTRPLKVVFGIFIVLVGVLLLMNELSPQKHKPSRFIMAIIGILAGITSGLFGIGVLMTVYVSQTTDNLKAFKANVCMVFTVGNIAVEIMYLILGIFTRESVMRALMLFPFVMLGLFLGMKSSNYLDDRKAKIVIMVTLIVSGLAIALTNL